MKKLMILFVSILLFSGCWEDVAGDIVLGSVKSVLESTTAKIKKENCEEYVAKYNWEETSIGKTIDISIKGDVIYILKEVGFYKFELSEINIENGNVEKIVRFNQNDIEEVNNSATSSIEDLIFMNDDKTYGLIVAYDINKHEVVWLKYEDKLNVKITKGFFYRNKSTYKNGKLTKYIDKINSITGEVERLFTFHDSINNIAKNKIENLYSYSDQSGKLFFTYALITKDDLGKVFVKIKILDYYENQEKEIASFSASDYFSSFNVIALDRDNIYVNINNDIFSYDRYLGKLQWSSYSLSNIKYSPSFFGVVGDLLISNHSGLIRARYKVDGDLVYTASGLYRGKDFKRYENNLYLTRANYFYRINDVGEIKDKFISKAYCESNGSSNVQKFGVSKAGIVIISDNKYIRRLEIK